MRRPRLTPTCARSLAGPERSAFRRGSADGHPNGTHDPVTRPPVSLITPVLVFAAVAAQADDVAVAAVEKAFQSVSTAMWRLRPTIYLGEAATAIIDEMVPIETNSKPVPGSY